MFDSRRHLVTTENPIYVVLILVLILITIESVNNTNNIGHNSNSNISRLKKRNRCIMDDENETTFNKSINLYHPAVVFVDDSSPHLALPGLSHIISLTL